MTRTIGEALRDEAARKLMTDFRLDDWQLHTPEKDDLPFVEPSRRMSIEVEPTRITIYSKVGGSESLSVWIELNGGDLFVHAYDSKSDEPVTLRISQDDIEVDTTARA